MFITKQLIKYNIFKLKIKKYKVKKKKAQRILQSNTMSGTFKMGLAPPLDIGEWGGHGSSHTGADRGFRAPTVHQYRLLPRSVYYELILFVSQPCVMVQYLGITRE